MEDAHATILSLEEPSDPNPNAFFAVYDGHGGERRPSCLYHFVNVAAKTQGLLFLNTRATTFTNDWWGRHIISKNYIRRP